MASTYQELQDLFDLGTDTMIDLCRSVYNHADWMYRELSDRFFEEFGIVLPDFPAQYKEQMEDYIGWYQHYRNEWSFEMFGDGGYGWEDWIADLFDNETEF